jgi:hypothetical protein
VAATEGQWIFPNSKADANDLLTLAFRAGWTLACIPAARSLRVPVRVWRQPYGNLSKEQVQKKIAINLTAAERRVFIGVPPKRHGDILDAIGIGRGALRVLHTTKYDWHLPK